MGVVGLMQVTLFLGLCALAIPNPPKALDSADEEDDDEDDVPIVADKKESRADQKFMHVDSDQSIAFDIPEPVWNEDIAWLSLEEGYHRAWQEMKPIMVVLANSTCEACVNLKREWEASKTIEALSESFVMVFIENAPEPSDFKFTPDGDRYYPRIIFLWPDGERIDSVQGPWKAYRAFYPRAPLVEKAMVKVLDQVGTHEGKYEILQKHRHGYPFLCYLWGFLGTVYIMMYYQDPEWPIELRMLFAICVGLAACHFLIAEAVPILAADGYNHWSLVRGYFYWMFLRYSYYFVMGMESEVRVQLRKVMQEIRKAAGAPAKIENEKPA